MQSYLESRDTILLQLAQLIGITPERLDTSGEPLQRADGSIEIELLIADHGPDTKRSHVAAVQLVGFKPGELSYELSLRVNSVRLGEPDLPPPNPDDDGLSTSARVGASASLALLVIICAATRGCMHPQSGVRSRVASTELHPEKAQSAPPVAAKQVERASLLGAIGFDSQPASPPPEFAMNAPLNGAVSSSERSEGASGCCDSQLGLMPRQPV